MKNHCSFWKLYRQSSVWIIGLIAVFLVLVIAAPVLAGTIGFNGHNPTYNLGYVDGTHARTYTVAPNMRQSAGSLNAARSEIRHNEAADLYVNFLFDTTGKNIFLVYTTNGTIPTKTNGNVVNASFSKYDDPDRTWFAILPAQVAGTRVEYVFYISDNTLANGFGRVTPGGGYETTWTEGDRNGFQYTVSTVIDTFADSTDSTTFVVCPILIPTSTSFQNTGIAIGGQRDMLINCVSGSGLGDITINSVSSTLAFSQGSGVRATGRIVWDGQDNNGATIAYNGLGGADLTASGSNTAIHMVVRTSDLGIPFRMRVYSGTASDYRERSIVIPGGILGGSNVSIILPFTTFSTVGSGNFADVGAIEILFDGTNDPDADVAITLLEATNQIYDWGDLPDTYGTLNVSSGARHLRINQLRLGPSVNVEGDGKPGANVNLDDYDDGVIRPANFNWSVANGGRLQVTVNGCTVVGGCYFNGWIDWDNNGSFGGGEQPFSEVRLANGSHTLNFTVPNNGFHSGFLNARFRLCSAATNCNTSTGAADDGEVEDYRWQFGPTAVSLQNISVASHSPILPALAAALLLLVVGGGVLRYRRQMK